MFRLCENRSFFEGAPMIHPLNLRSYFSLGAVVLFGASLILFASPSTAKVILGEPEVDRASDQYDGLWCPAEQIQMYDGTFTADGPEVTLEFIATNHHLGNWRHERIDNVIVVPLADRNATYHLPDSALAASYFCLEVNKNYFHFSDVPPGNVIFLDQFHLGPNPGWDMTDGAYTNPGSSALNAFELPIDDTGGSLGLGLDQVPTAEATSEITINGFSAGQQYFVSTWTQCADPTIGDDLLIRVYGTEFFSIAASQPVDGFPSRGCAWGDYDNDGDHDLYVTNFDSPSKLWRNNGAGVLQDVTNAAGLALTTLEWGHGTPISEKGGIQKVNPAFRSCSALMAPAPSRPLARVSAGSSLATGSIPTVGITQKVVSMPSTSPSWRKRSARCPSCWT